MFTTGFSMNASVLAEDMEGETIAWMRSWSASLDAVIVGSIMIKDNDSYYNRMLWVAPDGQISFYDKKKPHY